MPPPPWRKIALGVAVVLVVAGGAAALIVPEIKEGKDERAAAERRKDAAVEAAKRRRLAAEGRPHSGQGARPHGDLSPAAERRARRMLVHDVEHAITRDARARVRRGNLDGPILATECEINPPSQRPLERDLRVRRMEYECVAITSRDVEGRFVVGHSFDAVVDYRSYRFKWAKVCHPPGEGAARLEC
ncbi:MAG: hypothetical protein ACJ75P_04735 [Gaiellaceae bacterium]